MMGCCAAAAIASDEIARPIESRTIRCIAKSPKKCFRIFADPPIDGGEHAVKAQSRNRNRARHHRPDRPATSLPRRISCGPRFLRIVDVVFEIRLARTTLGHCEYETSIRR
jgi:hypothetical protein